MEVEETTEQNAEEVSVPAKSEESQTEILESGADEQIIPESGADEQTTGFKSLFEKARQNVFRREETESDVEKPESETSTDEKIPEEEKETKDTANETEGEEKDESPEEVKESKKTTRSENFKKMESERDEALAKAAEIETRLTKLDGQLEKYGGVETVETAMELFELAADKTKTTEFVEKINTLPHKALIQKEIFESALGLPANRVYGINHVLQSDFGLEGHLSQPLLEKLFEFATVRLNSDATEFENFLERELELNGKEDDELSRLRSEIERLKESPKKEKEAPAEESPQEFASRIQKTYNEFEDATFADVSSVEFEKYGFAVNTKDSPEVKQAKQYLANAVKFAVAVEMREAKAHESLLDFWVEQSPEDSRFYGQAKKAYKNAMTLKVQKALKSIAPLLGAAKSTATPKEIPGQEITETAANKQNKSTITVPKKEPSKPLGFGAAFSQARKKLNNS